MKLGLPPMTGKQASWIAGLGLLGGLLFGGFAWAANNFAVTDFGGNVKILDCTETGNVCRYNVNVSQSSPLPLASTPITASSGNVANANAVATLAGVAAKTTYITGFQCRAAGATAALVVTPTVVGTITVTQSYTMVFPAGATLEATPLQVSFVPPVPASAVNTAIVVTLPAGGAGNTNATCSAQGYQL